MAGSNEANEANEANAGSLGRAGGSSFGVLPDRVDLPFITEGKVDKQRLPAGVWLERAWSGEWAAWPMLVDFTNAVNLPYGKPPTLIVVTPRHASPAGKGSCTMDASMPALPGAKVGTYTLRCTVAATNGGTFQFTDPDGISLSTVTLPGSANGSISFTNQLKFTIQDGANDFVVGDGFDITIHPPMSFSVTPRHASPNGKGTCVLDTVTPALPGVKIGTYTLRCTAAATNGGTFQLTDPDGVVVPPTIALPGSAGGTVTGANQLKFILQDGTADFALGDGFDIAVQPVLWLEEPAYFRRPPPLKVTITDMAGKLGNGTCVWDKTGPALPGAKVGTYTLLCTSPATNGGTFTLTDPAGTPVLTNIVLPGTTGGSVSIANQLRLIIQAGTADFHANDGFNILVEPLNVVASPKPGGNTGTGTCVPDRTTPALPSSKLGTYTLRCTATATNGGTFALIDPDGISVAPSITLPGSPGGSVTVTNQLKFVIKDGAVDFAIGDGFDIDLYGADEAELKALIRLAEDERADALGEIIAQHDGFMSYFMTVMFISPRTHPKTCLLLHIGSLLGCYVSMHFKGLYQRRRPSQRVPGLLPPIPVPGHPAFPSGHSTQAHLMARCVKAVLPAYMRDDLGKVIDELADRIARNREIAGLHFETDTRGGEDLAQSAFAILASDALPLSVPQSIPPTPQSATLRRFAKIVADAKGEWT